MRMSIGDLTPSASMGLPALPAALADSLSYRGGLTGLGDTIPQGPVSPDITQYYEAGLAVGAGGTPGIDLSQGFPSAEAQAAFVSGANAAQSPVTVAQITGAQGPVPITAVPTMVMPTAATPSTGAPVQISAQTLLIGGGLLIFAFLLIGMGKR